MKLDLQKFRWKVKLIRGIKGDLLHFVLNGRVKSTIHRVVAPQKAESGKDGLLPARFSIPFFVHPSPNVTLDPVLLPEQDKSRFKGINAGEWRAWRIAKAYGMAGEEEYFLNKMAVGPEVTATAI